MSSTPLILAIDQGSGSTKAILVNPPGEVVGRSKVDIITRHPEPGWVEQDAQEIFASVMTATTELVEAIEPDRVAAVGISTQRESLVVWERATGAPVSPVLTWQDRRTAEIAASLAQHGNRVAEISGLPLDPMFTAVKATWVLDRIDPERRRARAGELCIGTVDAWLLWNLGAGAVIEIGNASRTQLLDVRTGQWSPELLDIFNIPREALPEVVASDHTHRAPALDSLGLDAPIRAVFGDSHAALFAHGGWAPGRIKVTYGTGSSMMTRAPLDLDPVDVHTTGVTRTIAWEQNGEVVGALEGNILSTGATLVWLADLLSTTVDDLLARASGHETDVVLVPAFNGLGAPWWDANARAVISGFTLGTRIEDLATAAVNSIAFQVSDVLGAFAALGVPVDTLLADGGPSTEAMLMQRQADVAGCQVSVSTVAELSAYGAAALAGIGAGLWHADQVLARNDGGRVYLPQTTAQARVTWNTEWREAVARSRLTFGDETFKAGRS
jgi:glycerol kinase